MRNQPMELSTIIIKQRVKKYHENPKLVKKMLQVAEEKKPDLIITPQFAFYKSDELVEAYHQLKEASPSTALVTARDYSSIILPEPGDHPLESMDWRVLSRPCEDKRFLALDLLISMGEATPEEFLKDFSSLRTGGCLVRIMNSNKNYVYKKIQVQNGEFMDPIYPLSHDNMKIYDWYVLKF